MDQAGKACAGGLEAEAAKAAADAEAAALFEQLLRRPAPKRTVSRPVLVDTFPRFHWPIVLRGEWRQYREADAAAGYRWPA